MTIGDPIAFFPSSRLKELNELYKDLDEEASRFKSRRSDCLRFCKKCCALTRPKSKLELNSPLSLHLWKLGKWITCKELPGWGKESCVLYNAIIPLPASV
jgi:hypothetical protein